VNGDGHLDLVTVNNNKIGVLLNNGNGTFGTPTEFPAGADPFKIAAGDLDGDGDIDIALANGWLNNSRVNVIKNLGNGIFAAPTPYVIGSTPYDIAIVDLDSDGKLDIATVNYTGANVSVLLNQGGGTMGPAATYGLGVGGLGALAVDDFNGDGRPDIAALGSDNSTMRVLLTRCLP